jgi:hypothetical protein
VRNRTYPQVTPSAAFPVHGLIGIALIAVFWLLNWTLPGPRTHWGFFPLWLGYCLTVDALVFYRRKTSLLTRNWRIYIALFALSVPAWWTFEALNLRLQNWYYDGGELFSPFWFAFWATINFSVVIPAIFGTAELAASFDFVKRFRSGPIIRPDRSTTISFFFLGWMLFALMMAWPRLFFPFSWLSLFFILEPINIWLGYPSLTRWTRVGDWRPILALWMGALITGFFWELWNYYSYPKWIYQIPWGDWLRIFEMPLLGYGGYMPFALELYAMVHLIMGLLGKKHLDLLRLNPKSDESYRIH